MSIYLRGSRFEAGLSAAPAEQLHTILSANHATFMKTDVAYGKSTPFHYDQL